MSKTVGVLISLLCIFGIIGCGYHFIGQSEVLSGIHTVAIPYFENDSYEPGLERYMTEALVNEFVKSKTVSIVDEGDADAVIRGKIELFKEFVIAYDKDDSVLEYLIQVELDVTLEKRDTGEVIWRNKELSHFEEYRVSSEIAVTEANKGYAIRKTAVEMAERIHDSIIEGF